MSEKMDFVIDTHILCFQDHRFSTLLSSQVSPNSIGLKAFGLLCLPETWYPPFFICDSQSIGKLTIDNMIKAFSFLNIDLTPNSYVIIRSNLPNECLSERGGEDSYFFELKELDKYKEQLKVDSCKWLIQEYKKPVYKGHLSNERRVSRVLRDWTWEIEDGASPIRSKKKSGSFGIRDWRDSSKAIKSTLSFGHSVEFDKALKQVAKWAYEKKLRVHFEWVVADGKLFVVQVDLENQKKEGRNPKLFLHEKHKPFPRNTLKLFKKATQKDFTKYQKLNNTRIYKKIGYEVVDFYICHDKESIQKLLVHGVISDKLKSDLICLTSNPLVIRTDGGNIPEEKRVMLPRSDELRSLEAAECWLIEKFRNKIIEAELENSNICLIAHHFLPAVSSAWCLATPSERRVRVESLWGIPEGLYWYSHDVFDVDTKFVDISLKQDIPTAMKTSARTRYKDKYIAPNNKGDWVLYRTDDKSDWHSSISDWSEQNKQSSWVSEIAWSSRKIAAEVGEPVVIMWLIDTPKELTSHSVMPWYHTLWESGSAALKAAPKKKSANESVRLIRNKTDWESLRKNSETIPVNSRIIVEPDDTELVRNQKFAEDLAKLAKNRELIIELSGGILSHAFYMLSKHGAVVECRDLYATEDEELEFNKLVRDKIPENIVSGGEHVEVIALKGEAYLEALKRKVVEESYEVLFAQTTSEIIEELADLEEVVKALKNQLSISDEDVTQIQNYKRQKRGGFDRGLMLNKTILSPTAKQSLKKETLIPTVAKSEKRTINMAEKLPTPNYVLHTDNRTNDHESIKQFTLTVPFSGSLMIPTMSKHFIAVDGKNQIPLDFRIDVERNNADLKVKVSIVSTPKQLDLDL